jgi:hypothetical protein
VLAAAERPDHLVPGISSAAYWAKERWFNARTLAVVYRAGYADIRPQPWDQGPVTWHDTGRDLYLTPAGRVYAGWHTARPVGRRRIVIVACGSRKATPDYARYGYRDVIPAGQLYTGAYHRSLRQAADALTHPDLIWILSARHGLVPLDRPLVPYDVRLGDPGSITPLRLAQDAAALGLGDADVVFLGGRSYAQLLATAVPHTLAPLHGTLGEHRAQCRRISREARAEGIWERAADCFDRPSLESPGTATAPRPGQVTPHAGAGAAASPSGRSLRVPR